MFYQRQHPATPDYLHIHHGVNFSFPPHMHECFEIISLVSGEMHVTVDHREYCLHANEIVFIFPHQIHNYSAECGEHYIYVFSPKLIQAYHSRYLDVVPKNNLFAPHPYLIQALQKLTKQATLVEKMAALYPLCVSFEEHASYIPRETAHSDLLSKIFLFVENEFQNDCSLTTLADTLGYEYTYLSRFFKNTIGIPFHTYVNQYRLHQACYIMDNSDQTILQCALDSGYTNMRSFNRHFISYYGITPREYRRHSDKLTYNSLTSASDKSVHL